MSDDAALTRRHLLLSATAGAGALVLGAGSSSAQSASARRIATPLIPPYWKPWQTIWKARMGDYTSPAGQRFLEERSPLNRVDRIVRPLLIAQGANDVRVKPSESEQIVAAMVKRGIPVTYVHYTDEGHGFRRPENRRSFTAVVEAFLAHHLGGRHEPVGTDFAGSTIEFKAGRQLIPSLRV